MEFYRRLRCEMVDSGKYASPLDGFFILEWTDAYCCMIMWMSISSSYRNEQEEDSEDSQDREDEPPPSEEKADEPVVIHPLDHLQG